MKKNTPDIILHTPKKDHKFKFTEAGIDKLYNVVCKLEYEAPVQLHCDARTLAILLENIPEGSLKESLELQKFLNDDVFEDEGMDILFT
jgi:hypothetical protein